MLRFDLVESVGGGGHESLGKNWIHMEGLDGAGRIVLRRRVGRDRLLGQTGNLVTCVANRLARIAWAVLAGERRYAATTTT